VKTLVSTEPTPSCADSLQLGAQIGPWVVEHELGRGGMGVVYAVRHAQIGKRAALKVMHRRHEAREQISHRMLLEAQVVNAIGHPNIVDVFDVGATGDGRPYIVMEQLAGVPLSEAKVDRPTAFAILAQVCDALIAAHAAGVVHRDLKPENMFLVEGAPLRVKLLDWGIARVIHLDAHQTTEGQLVGTPRYLAPEQARGEPVTLSTDVYSLGVVAYELLLGGPPFHAESAAELLGQHLYMAPRAPRSLWPGIPRGLEALLLAMLAKDQRQRPTIQQVADRLATLASAPEEPPPWASEERPPARPARRRREHVRPRRARSPIVVGLATLAAAAALIAFAIHSDAERPAGTAPHAAPQARAAARPAPRALPVIANPVVQDCADPSILRDGPRWYLSCTGGRAGNTFPIHASTDLTTWQQVGWIFPAGTKPTWADGDTWSPQLVHLRAGYRAYFTMRVAGGHNAIGVASAASPTGPYEDLGTPLLAPAHGASDPYVATIGGRTYLYYKHEGSPPTLSVVPLSADGRALAGTPREVLAASEGWEAGNIEAPMAVQAGKHTFLFYSGSVYCDPGYAIGVARANSPLGPFEKLPHPLLARGDTWVAPGHTAITEGAGGEHYVAYHAYRADEGMPSCDDTARARNRHRHVRLDSIDLSGAWPQLAARL
jgi:tRNA A-37 threonylcarbamoyl transferase component Bud32